MLELAAHHFKQDYRAGQLEAARRGAGTSAEKHEREQYPLRDTWPQIEVCGRVSGGRDDPRHLKGGVTQAVRDGIVDRVYRASYRDHGGDDNADVYPQLRAL